VLKLWTTAKYATIKEKIGPIVQRFEVAHLVDDTVVGPPMGHGDVILCFGMTPFNQLKNTGLIKKGATLGKMREQAISYGHGNYMVTYDPGILYIDPFRQCELEWDISLAVRLHETNSLAPPSYPTWHLS